jgi:hypothetical protein
MPDPKRCKDVYKKQGLELGCNNNSFIKSISKHVTNTLTFE